MRDRHVFCGQKGTSGEGGGALPGAMSGLAGSIPPLISWGGPGAGGGVQAPVADAAVGQAYGMKPPGKPRGRVCEQVGPGESGPWRGSRSSAPLACLPTCVPHAAAPLACSVTEISEPLLCLAPRGWGASDLQLMGPEAQTAAGLETGLSGGQAVGPSPQPRGLTLRGPWCQS